MSVVDKIWTERTQLTTELSCSGTMVPTASKPRIEEASDTGSAIVLCAAQVGSEEVG